MIKNGLYHIGFMLVSSVNTENKDDWLLDMQYAAYYMHQYMI